MRISSSSFSLAWPDAFPASDAGVRLALGGMRAAQALQPWRGYATMRLWHALNHTPQPNPT